jgi:hypothetical protein
MKKKANPKRVRKRKPPPRAPKNGRVPLYQQLGITKAQEDAVAERCTRQIRQWWKTRDLDAVLDTVSISTALRDLGLVSTKVLLQELTNPACPIEIRRHIAMTMAPKLAVEVRAAVQQQVAQMQQQSAAPPGQQVIDLSELLADLDGRAARGAPILVEPGGHA